MPKPPVHSSIYRAVILKLLCQEQPATVVEIGVFAGHLTMLIAPLPWVEKVWAIDPWPAMAVKNFDQSHMDRVADEVIRWANSTSNVTVLRMTSFKASKQFADGSIEFVEIDGDHSYDRVKEDIQAWMPKLKPGCIICGDNFEKESVARAVTEQLPSYEIEPQAKGRVWWSRKGRTE